MRLKSTRDLLLGVPAASQAGLAALRFPVQYLEVAEALIVRRHGRAVSVREACSLPPVGSANAPAWIDGCQLLKSVVLASESCAPDESPALEMLKHFPVTAHGVLGLLAITSPTVGDAFEAALRYHTMLMPLFDMHPQPPSSEGIRVRVVPRLDLGRLSGVMIEIVVGSLRNIALHTAVKNPHFPVEFMHECQWSVEAYAEYFGIAPRFNAPWNSFLVKREFLSVPLITSSQGTHAHARTIVRQELGASDQSGEIGQQVRRRLLEGMRKGMLPVSDVVAREMAMSSRTLNRRLKDEGASFSRISEQVRIEHAEQLLLDKSLLVHEVARRVGFADASSFTRAFKRVTGRTPAEHRNRVP